MTENLFPYLEKEIQTLLGAEVYFRTDWSSYYFHIAGKCFGLLGENGEKQEVLTLKGMPEKNESLREQFDFVIAGYYMNKTHWNSILLPESTFTNQQFFLLVKESYQLVFDKLSKKQQHSLANVTPEK